MTPPEIPLGWPWPDNPPLADGTVDGIAWAIAAGGPNGMRTINGYARIPWEGHPWTGCTNYDELAVDVHGRLTYGPKPEFDMQAMSDDLEELTASGPHPYRGPRGLSTIPATRFADTGGWVGFDTGHAWDEWTDATLTEWGITGGAHLRSPELSGFTTGSGSLNHRWTGEQVIAEAKRLAAQIAAAASR